MTDREFINGLLELKKSEIVTKRLHARLSKKVDSIKLTEEDLVKPTRISKIFLYMLAFLGFVLSVDALNLLFRVTFYLFSQDLEGFEIFILLGSIAIGIIVFVPIFKYLINIVLEKEAKKFKKYQVDLKEYAKKESFKSELLNLDVKLDATKKGLAKLYTEKELPLKHRNLCDLVILNDYFDKGRCEELDVALDIYNKEGMYYHKEHIHNDGLDLKSMEEYCEKNFPLYLVAIYDVKQMEDEFYKNYLNSIEVRLKNDKELYNEYLENNKVED